MSSDGGKPQRKLESHALWMGQWGSRDETRARWDLHDGRNRGICRRIADAAIPKDRASAIRREPVVRRGMWAVSPVLVLCTLHIDPARGQEL